MYNTLQQGHTDLTHMQQCTIDIDCWYAENGMMLNPSKSETVTVGITLSESLKPQPTPSNEWSSSVASVDIDGTRAPFSAWCHFLTNMSQKSSSSPTSPACTVPHLASNLHGGRRIS